MKGQLRRLHVVVGVLFVGLASPACGNLKTQPLTPAQASAMDATVEDKDAGLEGLTPGLDLRRYRAIVVERFSVADSEREDKDNAWIAAMAPGHLHDHLVRRLRELGRFDRVLDANEGTAIEVPALKLSGQIMQLRGGSRHVRFWI